jgi:DNA segregation ATPase FtsK/SpoIIIE, S-DNA-T family
MGRLGGITAHWFMKEWFGIASFAFVFVVFIVGFKFLFNMGLVPLKKAFLYSFFFLIWTSVFFGFVVQSDEWLLLAGIFGYESEKYLRGMMGSFGTALLLLFTLGSFIIIVFNPDFQAIWNRIGQAFSGRKKATDEGIPSQENDLQNTSTISTKGDTHTTSDESHVSDEDDLFTEEDIAASLEFIVNRGGDPDDASEEKQTESESNGSESKHELEIEIADDSLTGHNYQRIEVPFGSGNDSDLPDLSHLGEYDPTLDLPHYKIPGTDLLDDRGNMGIQVNKQELEANKNRIIETLNNYAIQIDRIKATIGPTVTLYEIIPAPGVRISKIKNLENDIALSLSALGIRIIAPIPGKGTIGIEVPNSTPEIVSMKSILSSDRFQNSGFELPIGLGKTIANETFIADLTKMPHLLMAGATGQGKSVGLNAVLASILYKKHPAYVKFVLVDPKKVELTLFSKIERHFLAKLPDAEEAIVTETRQVIRTLNSLCVEMDNRYDLLKDAQTRNIKEYNTKFVARKLNPNHGHRFLPYIILFIDEFADLIMTAGKEIELPIARLAQLSRAVGLHLIIATQRPSVNIITGTIKANFPARIAFRVTSKIDSRTILDSGGAEQLIGRGDMLLSTGSDLIRLQCAFIDTPEIERITEFIGSQRAYPDAYHLPEYLDEESSSAESIDPSERDELFDDAARVIVATQQGSTSLLQRKLKLGYNRAGRIIDQLEAAGIVGPFEGSKARDVKIKDEASLEQILRRDNN